MHRIPAVLLMICGVASPGLAGPPSPLDVRMRGIHRHQVVLDRSDADGGGIAGACEAVVVAPTESDFGPGEYVAQGGFIEGEIAATSFELPPDAFPVRLDLFESLFATSSTVVETTTEYAIYVWSGRPDTGTLVFNVASDGDILPHITMPPGTTGVRLEFLVDPGDPDRIWIDDDG